MNRKELKKLMKPIVEECIREVLLQEGVLSTIISEVMKGTSTTIVETKQPSETSTKSYESEQDVVARLQERKQRASSQRKKLLDAIGTDAYNGVNLFEGTDALNKGGDPASNGSPQGPLSGYAPDDAGVNIDGLLNLASSTWKKMK